VPRIVSGFSRGDKQNRLILRICGLKRKPAVGIVCFAADDTHRAALGLGAGIGVGRGRAGDGRAPRKVCFDRDQGFCNRARGIAGVERARARGLRFGREAHADRADHAGYAALRRGLPVR